MDAETVGISYDAVTEWFHAHVRGVVAPLRFTQIAGGRSNLTYEVTDSASGRWILRRPPLGVREGNAHNVVREADVLKKVAGTGVPAPAVLGVCDDERINGAPFFVMEHLAGAILRGPADFGQFADPAQRSRIAYSLIEVMATLHRADLAPIGWGARTEQRGFIERQLARWSQNWVSDRVRVLPDIEHTRDILLRRVPVQHRASVVHGDFRLDNCLIGPDCTVTGVLDWELTTVGDPLADLGQFLVYWAQPGDEVTALENPPTLTTGLPSRAELVRGYRDAMRGTLDVAEADVDFYVAFSWWKTACIVENVYTRMSRGSMGRTDRSPESFAAQAERLAAQAWACAQQLR